MRRTIYLFVILALILTAAPASAEVSTYAQAQKYILSMGYPGSEQRLIKLLDQCVRGCIENDIPYDPWSLAKALCQFEARLVHSSKGGYEYITDKDMVYGAVAISWWSLLTNDNAETFAQNLTTYVQETSLTIEKAVNIVAYICDATNYLPSFVSDRSYQLYRFLDDIGFDVVSLAQLSVLCLLRDVDPLLLVDYWEIYMDYYDYYDAQKNLRPLIYSAVTEPNIRVAEDVLAAGVKIKSWNALISDLAFGLNWPGTKPLSIHDDIEAILNK